MKYYIKTFGCQMNFSDSERVETFFEQNGCGPAKKIDQADLVIFNTCGVRQTAEDRVYGQVHNLRTKNKEVIIMITGCLSHRKDVQRKLKDKADLFIPIGEITKLFDKLKKLRIINYELSSRNSLFVIHNSKDYKCNKQLTNDYLSLKPAYKNSSSAFVPIMTGCNNFCSYCVVPYARGREWSRPVEDIVDEIDTLCKNGCKKVILLGQNVNSYSYRIEYKELSIKNNSIKPGLGSFLIRNSKFVIPKNKHIDFPLLLNLLSQTFPRITFNFLTSHPKDYSDKLIDVIAKNKNISREIHLPIQSGSDKILKAMNRPYTQKHYLNLIAKTKKKIPRAKFSTDIIVGFPGETEEDFQQTVNIFKKIKFFEAFINKYSPRPGTASFKLEDNISWNEKKRREKILRLMISDNG